MSCEIKKFIKAKMSSKSLNHEVLLTYKQNPKEQNSSKVSKKILTI